MSHIHIAVPTDAPTTISSTTITYAHNGKRCPLVIDTRTQLEWDAGHAPCAHRLEIQNDPAAVPDILFVLQVLSLVKGDLTHPVQLYCSTGDHAGRAVRAQKLLQKEKWTRVTNAGGWESGQADAIKKLCDCKRKFANFVKRHES